MSAWLMGGILMAAALIAAFLVYAPSLSGDFVFDDRSLPMFYTNAVAIPLRAWLGVRPLLMATFYFSFHTSGLDTTGYHALNVILHSGCAVLVFFAIRRLLEWANADADKRTGVAAFRRGAFPAASRADRGGELHRQPIGNVKRVAVPGGIQRVSLSAELGD